MHKIPMLCACHFKKKNSRKMQTQNRGSPLLSTFQGSRAIKKAAPRMAAQPRYDHPVSK